MDFLANFEQLWQVLIMKLTPANSNKYKDPSRRHIPSLRVLNA